MKWMGHKSIDTTMKYYVVSPEEYEAEAIKRLDGNYRATGASAGQGEGSQSLIILVSRVGFEPTTR